MGFTKAEFDTPEGAVAFIEQINKILGIPVSEDAVTETYTEPIEENGKWYVEYESNIFSHE